MQGCSFCEIDNLKTRIISNGSGVFVALSNPRLMPGHLLVIPKRHVERISQLNKDEKEELFQTIERFQEKILDKVASGCDITQHHRPFIPESRVKVNHLHVHLRPREFKDALYETSQKFEQFQDVSSEEVDKLVGLLN